jgi:hypothetical protein
MAQMIPEAIQKNIRSIALFGALDAAVASITFLHTGLYNLRTDALIYVGQVEAYTSGQYDMSGSLAHYFFKPFYGIVGSWLAPVLNPFQAILVINLLFLCGLTAVSYFLYRELGFDKRLASVGVVWTIFSYTVFKYGLSISTDSSGWFFCASVMLVALRAVRVDSWRSMVLAGMLGFIGSISKETGVLGLIFSGTLILFQWSRWSARKIIGWLAALSVPFIVLEAVFLLLLRLAGAPSFVQWFGFNSNYAPNNYKLIYFLGVQASTFHVMLLLALVGLWQAVRGGEVRSRSWLERRLLPFIAASPVFLWPIFLSRVLFIQFIYLVPLALGGAVWLDANWRDRKVLDVPVMGAVFTLPPIVALSAYLLSNNGSLFALLKGAFHAL